MQTKSLSTQLSLTTNQKNPGCLVIAGNTATWSATRASQICRTAGCGRAQAAVRLRGGQAVQAPGHERGPEAGLRLGRLRRTLDYSHLTSVLWGVCKGFQVRLDKVEAWHAQAGAEDGRRPQANHQGRLRGSPHRFRQHSADAAAGPGARGGEGVSGRSPGEPGPAAERLQQLRASGAHELQVDLADMKAFGGKPYPFMLVGHRCADQESGRGAAEGPSCEQ